MSDSEKSPRKKKRSFLNKIVHSFRKKLRDEEDDNEKGQDCRAKYRIKSNEEDVNNSQEASSSERSEGPTDFGQDGIKEPKNTKNIIDNVDKKLDKNMALEIPNRNQTPSSTLQLSLKLHSKKEVYVDDKDGSKNRKFIMKEAKSVDDSSDDSDYSITDSDDLSDENERLLDVEKGEYNMKDDYFTKGKYLSFFFLQMEKMNYNPNDVYAIIQYYDSDNPRTLEEKGTTFPVD